MEVVRIDATGMRCPQPVLILASKASAAPPGSIIELKGDCPTLERDVRAWADRSGKTILAVLGVPPTLVIQLKT